MFRPDKRGQPHPSTGSPPKAIGRRCVYLLLASVLLVNFAIRFPLTPHPLGSDTYQVLLMSDHLTDKGTGSWQLSPLSYLGYYPFSYPTGFPALVSAVEQLTGLTAELVMYLTSLAIAVLAALGAFVLCHRYTDDPRAALLAALVYGTMPVMIAFSNWQLSARGPFLAILPFFILALVARIDPWRKALIVGLLLFTALAFHRSALLLFPVLLVFLLLHLRPRIARWALGLVTFEQRRWLVAVVAMGAMGFGFLIPFMPDAPPPFDNLYWLNTEIGDALPEDAPGGGPSRLAVYIGGRWGPALLFGILGLLAVALRERKTSLDWILIGTVVVLAPFLPVAAHAYETLSVVTAILAAVFLVNLLGNRSARKQLRAFLAALVIVAMLAFSAYTVHYRTENFDQVHNIRNYVTDDEYSSSLYLLHETAGMHVFNDPVAERKITAIARLASDLDFVDRTTPIGFSWSDFWSRFVNNPVLTVKDPFTGPDELALLRDRLRLLQYHPDDPAAKAIMDKYDIEYLTVKRWDGAAYQPLIKGAMKSKYQIYASGDYAVYAL